MKNLIIRPLFLLVLSVSLFSSCEETTEEVVSPYVGNYVISSAALSQVLTVNTVQVPKIDVPVGMDITPAIQAALLSSAKCASADKAYIEMRKDFSLYMSCAGANPLNAGTWQEVSATTLKLNMNNAAIPSSPTGFVLTVTDIVKSPTGITGKTSVPLPKTMVAPMIAAMGAAMGVPNLTLTPTSPDMFVANFAITFVKK